MNIYVVVHGKKETFLRCAATLQKAHEIALNNYNEYGIQCKVKRVPIFGEGHQHISTQELTDTLTDIINLTYRDGVNSKLSVRIKLKLLLEKLEEGFSDETS